MKVAVGDFIGTHDGRYGEVLIYVNKDLFKVQFHELTDDLSKATTEVAWLGNKDVASIR